MEDEEKGISLGDSISNERDFRVESKSSRRGGGRNESSSEYSDRREEDNKYYSRDSYSREKSIPRANFSHSSHSTVEEEGEYFHMGVSGQIQSGEFKDYDGLAIKYCFVSKGKWIKDKGTEIGISQHSFKSSGISKRVIWNFPFEIRYRSTTIKDWPQMVFY